MYSKWIGDSQVFVTSRFIGSNKNKIIVDVFAFSPEGQELSRPAINRIAANTAMLKGAMNTDFCVITDYLTDRKVTNSDGTIAGVNVRLKSFVFRGME